MVATMERTKNAGADAGAVGEDGFPVRAIAGVPYSTKPYPEAKRPRYWNPLYPGQEMWWRSETPNDHGFLPVIQKETWIDGAFRPRNDWEREMTRQWMTATLDGCNDPEKWQGVNHPDGDRAEWRCECSWHCGNWHAFQAHLRYLRHKEAGGY